VTSKQQADFSTWPIPPPNISLKLAEVHLWQVNLMPYSSAEFWRLLSQDEQQRAEKFRQAKTQQQFVTVRGILRLLLGQYLESDPQTLSFSYGVHGKPRLQSPGNHLPLEFNLSHSGDLALYALTLEHPLGIDLEQIRPDCNYLAIAQRFFTAEEVSGLLSLPLEQQSAAFFQIWTAKEAYIKALGGSIFSGLSQLEVKLADLSEQNIWTVGKYVCAGDRCILYPLNPGAGYAASLVQTVTPDLGETESSPVSIQCWQWGDLRI
jgi:4'-phosphopantetheinyl transferase